ncbi:MAG: cardiolipin synthase, partial [Cyclobacteriaceae bacterium]|nr:cardiolipin synthase [Cyclobacteriaceae bacterium]
MAYFFIFLKIILILYYLIALIAVFYMILENRSPVKTISWILVLLLLPIMGGIFYFFIGHNFKKEKLFEGKKILDYRQMSRMVYEQAIDLKVPQSKLPDAIQAKAGIIQLLLGNGRSRLSKKNKIQILTNGEEKYRELIRSLKNAKSHIHLEYYIFEEGEIANTIKEILIDKSQKGVRVRFIYDQVGSWNLSNEYLNQLKDAGVLISVFRPVRFPVLTSKFNYRNHRKIVVVDGKEGFLGGINIADKYLKGDKKLGFWRDTHIKISGDAVNDLQLIFLTDWYFLTNDEISDEDKYFHDSDIADEKYIQVLASGPDTDFKGIMRSFFSAIATAKESIHIVSPYFLPTESVFTALKTAAMSGVD